LDDALQIVETKGARWLEAELNRHKGQLLLRQGHTEAAAPKPATSAPVYGWFTEGFDTQDLKEAKALLDELA
jgi:predicted ATPase